MQDKGQVWILPKQSHILPQGNNLKLSLSFSQVAVKMLEISQSVGKG